EAFARLAERHPDLDLVLSGGRGAAEEEVEALAAPLGERVLRLGRTGREQLDATMAAAEAVVFPSEFEGFGLPVLEALALGVPVICSDIAPLREVAGDAAGKVRRGDAGAWVDAIEARLRGAPARAELAAAGRAQAARFTPERTAAQLEAVYRSVLEGARPEGGPRGAGPG